MSKGINFRGLLMQGALITFTLIGASSCSNNMIKTVSRDAAEEGNKAKFDPANEKDAEFLVNAAEINLQEIQIGQMAQQNASVKEVKDFAKQMEEDHSKSMHELIELANLKSIVIPTLETDNLLEAFKKLQSLKGPEFNKAYCDMMVNGHKDAIVLFKRASEVSVDPDIRKWAAATLPVLNTHLDGYSVSKDAGEQIDAYPPESHINIFLVVGVPANPLRPLLRQTFL